MAGSAKNPGWIVAARSDPGRVRDHNEDAWGAAPELGFACVCDGMGGHACGEVASEMAVAAIRDWLVRHPAGSDRERLRAALVDASARIYARGGADPALRGMGTTATAALFGDRRITLAHAGDSRAYRLRKGGLEQLTTDHSLLQEFIDIRHPSPVEIALFPHKHVITRALGIEPELEPDTWEGAAKAGDRYLLCTDGLTNMVDDEAIAAILAEEPDAGAACERLIDAANEAGGEDNVTALILDYR